MDKTKLTSMAAMMLCTSIMNTLREKGLLTQAELSDIANNAWKLSTHVALSAEDGREVREFLERFVSTTWDD